jgi:hypothetical protein
MSVSVVGLQPFACRRCPVDRRDDLDQSVLHRNLQPQPAKLAVGVGLHFAKAFCVHVVRERIKRAHHAIDRGRDELVVVRLVDILRAGDIEHLSEQLEVAESRRRFSFRFGEGTLKRNQRGLPAGKQCKCGSPCGAESNKERLAHGESARRHDQRAIMTNRRRLAS